MPISPADDISPSRDRIIGLLRWGPRSVAELAAEVGLTLNGIRAQLAVLERDGVVTMAGVRHEGGVGKPPAIYALTTAAEERFSMAYPAALATLVEAVRQELGPDRFASLLTSAGQQLATRHNARGAEVLTALGAVVETVVADDGTETVRGAACPLAAAVRHEPGTCELVRSLLASSTSREVRMLCHHGERPRCQFAIAARSQAPDGLVSSTTSPRS